MEMCVSDPGPIVLGTGLVCSVGLSSESACAAIRARVSVASDTRFRDSSGTWIRGHNVALEWPLAGLARLARMAAMSVEEALAGTPREQWSSIPMLFCFPETGRVGRQATLDSALPDLIMRELDTPPHADSRVIPEGKVSVSVAMQAATELLRKAPWVLIVGVDSLLTWPALRQLDAAARLLSEVNSDCLLYTSPSPRDS